MVTRCFAVPFFVVDRLWNNQRAQKALWESSLNTVPMHTEEDKAYIATMKDKGKEDRGIKAVARRFEEEIIEVCCRSIDRSLVRSFFRSF